MKQEREKEKDRVPMDPDQKECLKVVMFPWVAHGHITPFLELAKALSHKNIHSYICSTPVNLISLKIAAKYSPHIHPTPLHLPSSPDLPPHYHTTNALPLHLQPALKSALKTAKPSFSDLLRSLHPHLLIHDVLLPWAGVAASLQNIPCVTFFTSGAAMFSYFVHLGIHPGTEFPFPAIRLSGFEASLALSRLKKVEEEEKDPDDEAYQRRNGVVLMNTSAEMEEKYIDYLSGMLHRKIIPIGAAIHDDAGGEDDTEMMDWLSRKDELSSVFVSFGSEFFLKKEEIEEIAYALELSKANFIWIIRFPKGEETKVSDVLPEGFLDRVGERGRIVEEWAPQARILRHPSVAGFVSHCGWNSLKESIDSGVPIIAMPKHLDQPMNAKLVVELGVGVEVKRGDDGKVRREEIRSVIDDVVFGETGEVLRNGVAEKREKIRLKSREEMEGVAELLIQICECKKLE